MKDDHRLKLLQEKEKLTEKELEKATKGVSKKQRNILYSREIFQEMKPIIRFRDSPKCPMCNEESYNFDVHHINKNVKENTPDNLVAICNNCHKEIHRHKMFLNFKWYFEEIKEKQKEIWLYYEYLQDKIKNKVLSI